MTLGLEERASAVVSPWNLMLGTATQLPKELPLDTSVISVFKQIGEGRTLLILGEPGAGKTVTLLQLARDLLAEAEQSCDRLIPVVFNLSSWSEFLVKRKSKSIQLDPSVVADWLVAELSSKYQVPKQIGRNWVKKQQLLLLLDGLDEVRLEHRDHCVVALNAFQQEYGTEMVVCSRIKDYDNLTNRLNFQSAIYLRALTQEQIYCYLDSLDTDLTSLRTLLEADTALQELALSPLMLHIMVLAYQDIPIAELPQVEIAENHRQRLFDNYIKRMLERRRGNQKYSSEQTLNWLSWLAQQMQRNAQTVFLIEQMQPTWLLTKKQKRNYYIGSVLLGGLSYGLLSGLILGIVFGLIAGVVISVQQNLMKGAVAALATVLAMVLIFTPLGFSNGALILGFRSDLKSRLKGGFFYGFLLAGLLGLFAIGMGITGQLELKMINAMQSILILGLSSGAYGSFVIWLAGGQSKEIEPAEKLTWSWQKARSGLFIGGGIGALTALANILTGQQYALVYLLCGPPIYGLASALINGLSTTKLETRAIPNQGIRSSMRNFVIGSLIIGLGCTLGTTLLMMPLAFFLPQAAEGTLFNKLLLGLGVGLFLGSIFGLALGLIGGMKFGGKAFVQHLTLRLLLHRQRFIPWNYAKFLDYATERLFLQKVGGGYIFIHRLMMEHVAQIAPISAIAQTSSVENSQPTNQINYLISPNISSESIAATQISSSVRQLDCHSCKQSNSAGSNFCIKCGVSLISTCPTCKYKNPGNFNFCTKCGTNLK